MRIRETLQNFRFVLLPAVLLAGLGVFGLISGAQEQPAKPSESQVALLQALEQYRQAEAFASVAESELLKAQAASSDQAIAASATENLQKLDDFKFAMRSSAAEVSNVIASTAPATANCGADPAFSTSRTRFLCKKDEQVTIEIKPVNTGTDGDLDSAVRCQFPGGGACLVTPDGKLTITVSALRRAELLYQFKGGSGGFYEVIIKDSQGKQFFLSNGGTQKVRQPQDGDAVLISYFFAPNP